MTSQSSYLKIIGGIVVGAITFWFNSYSNNMFLGVNIYLILGLGTFMTAFFLGYKWKADSFQIAILVPVGIIISLIARIIWDVNFYDATSHNLLPFEFIFALVVALPSAFTGAYLPSLFRYKKN